MVGNVPIFPPCSARVRSRRVHAKAGALSRHQSIDCHRKSRCPATHTPCDSQGSRMVSRMIKVTVKVAVKVTCCDSLGVMQARFRSRGSFFLSKLTLLSSSYGNSAFGAGPCWAEVALLGCPSGPGDICTSSSCSYVLELRPNSSTAPPAKKHHHHAPNPLQKKS